MALVDSVRRGLAELGEIDPRDQAAADLALAYAAGIDDPQDWGDRQRDPLAELGPKLLAALAALGMTPAARKGITTPAGPEVVRRSPLDELREKRAARGAGA